MHLPGNGIRKMLDCNSLSGHGTGQGARSLDFLLPFVMRHYDDIHGDVEGGEFAACGDSPLVTRDRGTRNDSKNVDIAVDTSIASCLRSEEPDSLGVNCRAQSIGHEAGRFRNVHGRSRMAEIDRMESVKTASMQGQREDGKAGRRETGDGRRETGDGRRETGDGRRETGDGRRESGDGRRETNIEH